MLSELMRKSGLFFLLFLSPIYVSAALSAEISCLKLLEQYQEAFEISKPISFQKLKFEGVGDKDVYNPTAPFKDGNRVILAGRVESRNSETDSQVMFFEEAGSSWHPIKDAPVFNLQDPFVSKIGKELIFGGVEVFPLESGGLGYKTVFYRGSSVNSLKKFTEGPSNMKDIRLLELADGNILVFTRPQGEVGGKGKISYNIISRLEDLNVETINQAKLINNLFPEDEWGGANELHLLKEGKVGVVGHVAKFDSAGGRHYYPMSFIFSPTTGEFSPPKILLQRDRLPAGASKRPDLQDVLFSGGLERLGDGTAILYVGAGDAEVWRVTINDPF